MEVKFLAGLILMVTTVIVAAGVSILFLFTIRNIEMQTLITESVQIKKVKDVDY